MAYDRLIRDREGGWGVNALSLPPSPSHYKADNHSGSFGVAMAETVRNR